MGSTHSIKQLKSIWSVCEVITVGIRFNTLSIDSTVNLFPGLFCASRSVTESVFDGCYCWCHETVSFNCGLCNFSCSCCHDILLIFQTYCWRCASRATLFSPIPFRSICLSAFVSKIYLAWGVNHLANFSAVCQVGPPWAPVEHLQRLPRTHSLPINRRKPQKQPPLLSMKVAEFCSAISLIV